MTASRFDPKRFFQRAENVALQVPADEVFGFLKRSLDLPASWLAMVSRTSGVKEVIRTGGVIDGEDADDLLFVRSTPLEVTIAEEGLSCADAMQCAADVTLHLSVIPESGELSSFARAVLGSHRVVQTQGLARFLQPVVRRALAQFLLAKNADALLTPETTEAVAEVIARALQAPCFEAGLRLDRSPVVRFESESARAVQASKDKAARALAEHEAASDLRSAMEQAQQSHIAHLAEVLERLNELARDAPQAALGDLIRTFPDHQRGELYSAVFAVEPAIEGTRWIVIAAGDDLLFFDPDHLEKPARTVRIDGAPGRVRSVQVGGGATGTGALWLGAQRGVYRLPLDAGAPDRTFVVEGAQSVRGGFNAVAILDEQIYASHSELGIQRWDAGGDGANDAIHESLTRGAKTVRHIQTCDKQVFCAIDERVVRWSPGGPDESPLFYTGSSSAITGLVVDGEDLFAGNANGDLLHWAGGPSEEPEYLHRGTQRAVESIHTLDRHGVRRLFFVDTSPSVHARIIGDDFTRLYEAGGQTLRRVEVAPDVVVAMNELRDRVFVWSTGTPGPARSVIPVGSLSGRSIQDICLVGGAPATSLDT